MSGFDRFSPDLIKIFDNAGNALAAANAGGDDAIFLIEAFHIVNELDGQFATCTPQWMAECDRAAIDVDDGGIDLQFADDGQSLRGECFIQFDQVDLSEIHAGLAKGFWHCFDGADAHDAGMDAGTGAGNKAGDGFQPELVNHIFAHDDDKGSAIAGLRGVAGRDASAGSEYWL